MRTKYIGSADWSFESLPFGDGYTVASGEDIDPRHFAGLDQDVNDNDHALYREYSSMTGRWMSPDPYSGSYNLANPQTLNRYAYVMNNPMAFTDPTGQQCMPNSSGIWIGCGFELFEMASQGGAHWLSAAIPYIGWGISIGFAIDDLGKLFGWWGVPQFHGSLTPRPSAPNNPSRLNCSGKAYVLSGNPANIGHIGFPGVHVTNDSAAIIPRQFTGQFTAGPFMRSIGAGTYGIVTGPGGETESFNTFTQTIGNAALGTAMRAQNIIMGRDPGALVIEIVGGANTWKNAGVHLNMPALGQGCPTGTSPVTQ